MDIETGLFFEKMPQALPLYEIFGEKVLAEYPDVQVKIQKTQISFSNKHQFALKRSSWAGLKKLTILL